jgi:hypothetical protein
MLSPDASDTSNQGVARRLANAGLKSKLDAPVAGK